LQHAQLLILTVSVFKHAVDSPDDLGVTDLAVGGGGHQKHCNDCSLQYDCCTLRNYTWHCLINWWVITAWVS